MMKLVRDRIPGLPGHPRNISFVVVAPESLLSGLYEKLHEEAGEFEDATNRTGMVEEAADMLEVLYTILDCKGISLEEVERCRQDKLEKKGGFKDGVIMMTLEEGEDESR